MLKLGIGLSNIIPLTQGVAYFVFSFTFQGQSFTVARVAFTDGAPR